MRNLSVVVSIFFMCSCSSIFKEECRVTGAYKDYVCPEDFDNVLDFVELNYDRFYAYNKVDTTCTQKFTNGLGCAFVIDDSSFLKDVIQNYGLSIPKEESMYWNLNTNTILGFKRATNPGSKLYDSIFFCINNEKKEYLLKCQYEIRDQCAGSGIIQLALFRFISTPKLKPGYTVKFDIEDVNPFKY